MGAHRAEARNFGIDQPAVGSASSEKPDVLSLHSRKASRRSQELRLFLQIQPSPQEQAEMEFELLMIQELTGNLTQDEITEARDRFGTKWLRRRGDGPNSHNAIIDYFTMPAIRIKGLGLISRLAKIGLDVRREYGYTPRKFGDIFDEIKG